MNRLNTFETNKNPESILQKALDHGLYRLHNSIILYDHTWIHNISNKNHIPSLNTLLEEWERTTIHDLSSQEKQLLNIIEQTEQWKIYTMEQVLPMLYPEQLEQNFYTLLNMSSFSSEKKQKVESALQIMKNSHKNQFRDEWLPYYIHPLKISFDLLKKRANYEEVVSGLLHDVVEDDDTINIQFLIDTFWTQIVEDIIKLSKKTPSWEKLTISQYLQNISTSPQVISVKGQDRINNIASTYFTNSDKRTRYIKETEEIYLPFFKQNNSEIADKIEEILKYIKLGETPSESETQKVKQIHDSYILSKNI